MDAEPLYSGSSRTYAWSVRECWRMTSASAQLNEQQVTAVAETQRKKVATWMRKREEEEEEATS